MRPLPSSQSSKILILSGNIFLLLLLLLPSITFEPKPILEPRVEKSEFIRYAQSQSNCFFKVSETKSLNYSKSRRSNDYLIARSKIYTRIHSRLYTLYLSEYKNKNKSISGEYRFTNEEEKLLLDLFE